MCRAKQKLLTDRLWELGGLEQGGFRKIKYFILLQFLKTFNLNRNANLSSLKLSGHI